MEVVRPGERLHGKEGKNALPPCGGELERVGQRRIESSWALTPPSLALPHKGGGEQGGICGRQESHSVHETSVTSFDGIGVFSHRPCTFAFHTPSFGSWNRKRAGTSSARIFCPTFSTIAG